MSSTVDFSAAKPILGKNYEKLVEEAKKAIDAVRIVSGGTINSDAKLIVNASSGTAEITLDDLNGTATTTASGVGIFTGPGKPDVSSGSPFSLDFTSSTATLIDTNGFSIWAGIGAQAGLPPTLADVTFS